VMLGEGYGRKDMLVAEIGMLSKPLKNLTLGVHIYNPTRTKIAAYNNEHTPTIFRFGGNYVFSDKVLLAAETEKDIAHKALFKTGLEYQLLKALYLRAGISTNPVLSSFGFGLRLKNLQADLSSNYNQVLGFSQQLGLTYVVNKKS